MPYHGAMRALPLLVLLPLAARAVDLDTLKTARGCDHSVGAVSLRAEVVMGQ